MVNGNSLEQFPCVYYTCVSDAGSLWPMRSGRERRVRKALIARIYLRVRRTLQPNFPHLPGFCLRARPLRPPAASAADHVAQQRGLRPFDGVAELVETNMLASLIILRVGREEAEL